MPTLADEIFRLAVMLAVLSLVARPAMHFKVQNWASACCGDGDFNPRIAPDLLFPQYRSFSI